MTYKMFRDLKLKERAKLKELLLKQKELTQKQINLLTKPLQRRINLIDKVLWNDITINSYVKQANKVSKFIVEWNEVKK
ncbi:hypothetical protein KY321_00465 [Candidatus Woesearchaeota archaeon]|nr:hypothetical protein [Candidatus Woesearchaeota archaeon]